jgi:hypothetical protein
MTGRPILLAGSLSLSSAAECFCKASALAGPGLKRLPDGETGARSAWIGWQTAKLAANPFLQPEVKSQSTPEYSPRTRFVAFDGLNGSDVRFEDLGYADAAINSYTIYAEMKAQGELPPHTRFQVSLPTPLAILTSFIAKTAQEAIEPSLEAGFRMELDRILRAIPHDELAVQWDVAVEFGILEVGMPFFLEDQKAGIVERLARLGNWVPPAVELGYHLCYGNLGLKHFKEPTDTALLVEISNAILEHVSRPVDWVHMPVPIERDDDGYFAPLAGLRHPPNTEVFLGLVHLSDGLEGCRRRMKAAARFMAEFGVASECGMSNRPPGWTESMLALHREVAALNLDEG